MADLNARIKPKKSSTSGEVPLAADLEVAELAINTADGTLFTKHTDNSVVTISGGGGGITLPSGQDGEALIWENGNWVAGPVIGGVDYLPAGDADFSSVELLLLGNGTNGSITFTDSSSNSRTATVTGNTQISTAQSKFGGSSISFDGNGDYLTFAADAALIDWYSTGGFTVEAWVYADSWSGWEISMPSGNAPVMVGNSSATQNTTYWCFGPENSGNVTFQYWNGSVRSYVTSSAALSTGTWHHIAATYDGTTIRVFVDGVLDGSAAVVGTPQTSLSFDLLIGTINGTYITGYIDDLRITQGVARYTANFLVPTTQSPTTSTAAVTIPYSIDNLDDVDTSTVAPTDGQALVWDAANSKWEPGTVSGGTVDPGDAYYNNVEVLLHFDGTDGSTTFTDDSKNSWTVTASNQAQISTTQSKFGGSSFYSGSTTAYNAATIADNDALTLDADFTIEAWIYVVGFPGTNDWAVIASKWSSGAEYTFLVRQDNSISFGWGSYNANSIDSPLLRSAASSVSTNTWMHIAVTRSGNDFKLYIDGVEADSATESSTPSNTASPLTIGGFSSGEVRRLNGYIDDFRITKGVARYTSAFSVPTAAFSNTQATSTSIDDNDDVDTSTVAPTDGQALIWDAANSQWEPGTVSGGGGTTLPAAQDGEALIYENGQWVAGPVIGGVDYTPVGGDADFNSVSLLLLGNGADGSTTFTDSSSSPFTFTGNGHAEISTTQSKFGGASIFLPSSTASYLSTTSDSSLLLDGDFTIEAWIYNTGGDTFRPIIGSNKTNWGGGAFAVDIYAGGANPVLTLQQHSGAATLTGTTALSLNTWHHVAVTRSGSTVRLFVDGVEDGSVSTTGTYDFSNNGTFYVGKHGWDLNEYHGYIDDLRITKGVARYTASFTAPTAELPSVLGGQITIPYSIDNLDDVDTSTVAPTDGQFLAWDNTAGKWEPESAYTLPSGTSDGDVPIWDGSGWVTGPSVNTLRQNYTPPTGFEVWKDTFLLRDPSLATLSADGLTATYDSGITQAYSTTTKSTGKWYWEIKLNGSTDANQTIGIGTSTTNWVGSGASGGIGVFVTTGGISNASDGTAISSISSIAAGDVMMFALDADAKKFWIGINGTWENSGDPVAGTGEVAYGWPDGKDWMFIGRLHSAGNGYTIETSGAVGTGIEIPATIDDLDDVDTSTYAPSEGQALAWDNTDQKWEPKTIVPDGTTDTQIPIWEQGQWTAGSAVSTLQSDYTAPSGFAYWSDTFLLRDPANATLSNNDLTATYGSNITQAYSTTTKSTGKWYWEIRIDGGTDNNTFLGMAPNTDNWVGSGESDGIGVNGSGGIAHDTGGTAISSVSSHVAGDIRMFALDADNKKFWIGKNGTWDNSGDPAAGTGEVLYDWTGTPDWMFICRIHTPGFGNTIRVTGSPGAGVVVPDSIDDLSDVDTSTVAPTDGQALVWDNAAQKWEPGTVSGGGGGGISRAQATAITLVFG